MQDYTMMILFLFFIIILHTVLVSSSRTPLSSIVTQSRSISFLRTKYNPSRYENNNDLNSLSNEDNAFVGFYNNDEINDSHHKNDKYHRM